jgi:TDG/mug DNA glycosylase family protein
MLDLNAFDVVGLKQKIHYYQPRLLAFTSKHGASIFFQQKKLNYGKQAIDCGLTQLWILPSTSGNARPHWPRLQHHWHELAQVYQAIQRTRPDRFGEPVRSSTLHSVKSE